MEWNEVDPKPQGSKSGGGGQFLKLESNKEYRVRIVGRPSEVRRYFLKDDQGKFKVAITDAGSECVILKKYKTADGEPEYKQTIKYVFNVFDRNDNDENGMSKLKVLEVSPTVARYIRDWAVANDVNPGAGHGADFKIVVTCKDSDRRNTRYSVLPMIQTPFTDQEKAYLKDHGMFDIAELIKATPQSEIEEQLGLSGGSYPAAATANAGSASSIDDDLGF